MADQRTMAKLLHAPIEGYAEGIMVPPILAEQFELKHSLINMMTSDQFFRLKKDNPHDHIRCDVNSNSSSEIAKLTHTVNQQTSVVTTAMRAILKQFQATPSPAFVKSVEEICVTYGGAHPYYQCLATDGNTFLELRDNIQGYVAVAVVNYNHALISNKEKLLELANTPLNENCSAVIFKKLLEKLGDPGKFLILCSFSELKCKSLANLGVSINLMPLFVWKKLCSPKLISTRMTLEQANQAICTQTGIARDVFVSVGKFTFPADFVIVDYESDPRVPLILGRPFLQTARALNDVHGEEMILHNDDVFDPNGGNVIKSLNDNPTPDHVLKPLFPSPIPFLFEIEPDQGKLTSVVMKDNLSKPLVHVPNMLTTRPTLMLDSDFIPSNNSLPEFETFYFDIKEKNSGSTTIHADISLLDLECFKFDFKPDPCELTSIVDSMIHENVPSVTNVNLPSEEDHSPLFAYVVWIFLSFLTYPVVPPNLLSFGNEDTIFNLGIGNYHFPSLLSDVSHQCETFMKLNVYPKLLNESLMEILSSTCSPMEQ
nr:reverse transcriptase domain-containing protein [Tanacetum cinerariifolium]